MPTKHLVIIPEHGYCPINASGCVFILIVIRITSSFLLLYIKGEEKIERYIVGKFTEETREDYFPAF